MARTPEQPGRPGKSRTDALIIRSEPSAREGRLWPEGSTRASFEAAVEAAKLAAPFRFHDCRHHFASWFMMRS